MDSKFSNKAFTFSALSIVALGVFMILKQLVGAGTIPSDNYRYFSALTMFLVVLFSFVGFIYNIRGRKEPKTIKKTVSLIINSLLMILFLVTTIVNIIDIIAYLKDE